MPIDAIAGAVFVGALLGTLAMWRRIASAIEARGAVDRERLDGEYHGMRVALNTLDELFGDWIRRREASFRSPWYVELPPRGSLGIAHGLVRSALRRESPSQRLKHPEGRDFFVNRALAFAATWHAGQVDKQGVTYILHPTRVMHAVYVLGPAHAAAGVLHDVVEDTLATLELLREEGFPEEVVVAVDALTRREGERYTDFIIRCSANDIARAVKIADIEDNLGRITPATPDLQGLAGRYHHALHMLRFASATEAAR